MRGIALVFTVAFVFASASLLVGEAAGQETDASYPDPYQQPPADATLQGIVTAPDGSPIEGAWVSSSSYGSGGPEPMPAEDAPDSPDGSGGSSSSDVAVSDLRYYGGYNSTSTGPDGRYVLGVHSGDNQVSVHHEAYVGQSIMVSVEPGQSLSQDFALQAYPEKTAHIVGKITDARSGQPLAQASITVRSPLYGLYECSMPAGQSGGGSAGSIEPARDGETATMIAPYEPYGCAITMNPDGTFEGRVTPGYSIISVYAYQDCTTTRDADGGGATTCGPDYLPWTRTLTLQANETMRIDIALPSRPAPDATVSGYLVDAETLQAIPDASIHFSNQETYAWGSATTDKDGSYKIRLRSGYHSVSVYAPGHFGWEGILQVKAGSSDFDVRLTPGQESYGGGCCWLYGAEKGMASSDAALPPGAPSPSGGLGQQGVSAERSDGSSVAAYEDLGGGLGPYDAEKRAAADADSQLEDKGAPGAGLLLVLVALGAVLVVRRRMA